MCYKRLVEDIVSFSGRILCLGGDDGRAHKLVQKLTVEEEMTMVKKKLIACQIFTDELLAVLPEEYKDIDITWLNAGLHMNLDKLWSL